MRSISLLTTFASAAVSLFAPAFVVAQDAERIALEISEETTFFTEPVNDDGTIDYVAALNAHYGEGVSNEDNAFVLLFQLFPAEDPDSELELLAYWSKLYDHFGIEWDPDFPRYIDWPKYAESEGLSQEQANEIYDLALSRPWTADEFPLLSIWIALNESVASGAVEAIERPHYYSPLIRIHEDEALLAVTLPQLGHIRNLGRLLCLRANLSFGNNDDDEAIRDLLHLQRMGFLVSTEQTEIGKLVGISVQYMQEDTIEDLALRGHLEHDLAIRFLRGRAEIPPIQSLIEVLLREERCMVIDAVVMSNLGVDPGWDYFYNLQEDGSHGSGMGDVLLPLFEYRGFDVNRSLKSINERYDQLMKISEHEDVRERRQKFVAFYEDQRKLYDASRFDLLLMLGVCFLNQPLPSPDYTVEQFTDQVTNLYALLIMSDIGAALKIEYHAAAERLVESTAIAILGYRDVHGELPDTLDALVPVYFEAVPVDPYSEAPLVYRVDDDGSAVVYSIGGNFVDDEGVDDYRDGDITIRINENE